jgi:putative polyhydroxyalkanoate system protein
MADIHIVRAHHMSLQQAKDAATRLATKLEEKFDLATRWEGDTLHFERAGATGSLALDPQAVTIEVRLGLLLSAFKGAMEEQINEQLDKLFSGASSAVTAAAKSAARKRA